MEEAGGVELDKFHVGHLGSCPPCHCHSIPGRDGGTPPAGEASLAFSPTWGGARAQFQGQNWQTFIDLAIFQPARAELRDTRLVVMLCAPSDPTCQAPVLLREVAADETDGDPIQNMFGPDVAVRGLPAGEYELMIFADTGLSRSRGHAWDDGFETDETAWGGVVSELDVMMSAVDAAPGVTPPPATRRITLVDGETLDLGTIELQHVHDRDISPAPTAESGTMAVAIAQGLRLIDLSTHTMIETAPSSGFYTHAMVGPSGSPFAGTVCGMVRGPADTVFVLYQDRGVGAGFAVQFDVATRTQLHGGRRVVFPGDGTPCRGFYHDVGPVGTLYVTNASASRLNRDEAAAAENLWVAPLTGLSSGDVVATRLDRAHDPRLQHGVDDLASDGRTLYFSISGESTAGGLPSECTRSYCVFAADIDRAGVPTIREGEYLVGPEIGESYPTPMGDVTCIEEASPWAPIEIATFHDGRRLLFLGACLEVAVFDLATGDELDLSPAPGVQGVDGTRFGYAMNELALSPDGQTLWALPQLDSPIHFYFRRGVEEPAVRSTGDRHMALPIDLSRGTAPALHPAFTGDDIDGYEGTTDTGPYRTPAADPGVDINHAYYAAYLRHWIGDAPSFQPAASPTGPSLAVTRHALWVRGAGNAEAGASGLGKSGNLAVYDLATRRAVLFPYDDAGFYRFWHGGAEGSPSWGFDLTPENGETIATFGLEYFER